MWRGYYDVGPVRADIARGSALTGVLMPTGSCFCGNTCGPRSHQAYAELITLSWCDLLVSCAADMWWLHEAQDHQSGKH